MYPMQEFVIRSQSEGFRMAAIQLRNLGHTLLTLVVGVTLTTLLIGLPMMICNWALFGPKIRQ